MDAKESEMSPSGLVPGLGEAIVTIVAIVRVVRRRVVAMAETSLVRPATLSIVENTPTPISGVEHDGTSSDGLIPAWLFF